MCGADETMRNLLKICRQSPHPPPQFTGIFPGHVTENAAERTDAVPAGLQGDFDDRKVRVAQQRNGTLYSAGQKIAVRGYAESIAKRSCEMSLRGAADARKA